MADITKEPKQIKCYCGHTTYCDCSPIETTPNKTNMKQQTAVEWLVSELNQKIDFIPMDKWDMIKDIVQQAKEMEKNQIINAYEFGVGDAYDYTSEEGELFYNEIYGK